MPHTPSINIRNSGIELIIKNGSTCTVHNVKTGSMSYQDLTNELIYQWSLFMNQLVKRLK